LFYFQYNLRLFIGSHFFAFDRYPNVGKSSVINTLRSKKVCKVAPIAGETKVWQYITLMSRIYLIDCPGVVYPYEESNEDKVLKGVVRVELVESPEDYIEHVLARVKKLYMAKTYKIDDWTDGEDFLTKLAQRTGKLLKGGEPDLNAVARMVLNDWQRGRIPYFSVPAGFEKPLPKKKELTENSVILSSEGVVSNEEKDSSAKAPENNPEGSDATIQVKTKKLKAPHLSQNFRKILVGHKYEGDDIQPLEEDDFNQLDNEDLLRLEEEKQQEEEDISIIEDSTIATNTSTGTTPKAPRDSDDSSYLTSSESEHEDDETATPSKGKNSASSSKIATPEGKGMKRKSDGDVIAKKLTSKERRRLERDAKRKKIGSNFYEVTNVKNRNRDRKTPKVKRNKIK